MGHAADRRPVAFSFALLAWLLAAVAAHSHGHHHALIPDSGGEQKFGAAADLSDAQHSSSVAHAIASRDPNRAVSWTASAASVMATSLDGAWRQRQRHLLRTVSGREREAPTAASVHLKLAAAAKADIAAKSLRARKAGMYPASPARRALAEDPNQAVRCVPVTMPSAMDIRHGHATRYHPRQKLL